MKIIISRAAVADLARLHEFLASKNAAAAQRTTSAIAQAIDSLADNPDRARPSEVEDARELVVPFGRSAYLIRFAHDGRRQEVTILRIWHGREKRD